MRATTSASMFGILTGNEAVSSGKATVDDSGFFTDVSAAMTIISHILSLADAYQAATGLSDTTLSWRVFGDSKKLASLRDGADLFTGRAARAVEWFSANWPEGATWPPATPRPIVRPPYGAGEAAAVTTAAE